MNWYTIHNKCVLSISRDTISFALICNMLCKQTSMHLDTNNLNFKCYTFVNKHKEDPVQLFQNIHTIVMF